MFELPSWVIIGKTNCPWCDKVKKLLDSYKQTYTYFSIDEAGPLANFVKACGHTTVPLAWDAELFVGGYEDVAAELSYRYGHPSID